MRTTSKLRTASLLAIAAALLACVAGMDLAAQTTTGIILGTVTDPSGAAVPEATIRITNEGTAVNQVTMSDSQGRYRVPDLPIGQYDVQTGKMGFETVIHKGITLSVGGDAVVDFALPVGQVAQTVTVEGDVSQVETTSSAISNLVDQTQIRELPLNGRDFEQLILLSPGVTIMQAIGLTATNGFGASYSVAGSRTRGQWEIMDDNDVMNYQQRNSGSGVLGTSLGIDAIAEFEILTNTYSAQYGGNGSVVNSVTKSGTNALHGSGYEFFRNSALDARNFFDPPKIPLLQKNQFGGTLGGPIKKDKMFFFANYEGVWANTGTNTAFFLPDEQAHSGFIPSGYVANGVAPAAGQPYTCVNNPSISYNGGAAAALASCAATLSPAVQKFMAYFPNPTLYPNFANNVTGSAGQSVYNGVLTTQETAQSPGHENYAVGRYDWNISSNDSIFARYVYDAGALFEPFDSSTLSAAASEAWGTTDYTKNQFLSIEEKHIFSPNVISSARFGFSRTFLQAYNKSSDPNFQFDGSYPLWAGLNFPVPANGTISIPTLLNPNYNRPILGGGSAFRDIQNKFGTGEDLSWNKGAHSLRFGVSLQRIQTNALTAANPGTWLFGSIQAFVQQQPSTFSGPCVATIFPVCNLNAQIPVSHFQETDFGFYVQDDWKVRSTVTLNLGLRYEPTTNPHTVGAELALGAVNLPLSATYNPSLAMPGCSAPIANPFAPPANAKAICTIPAGQTGYSLIHNIFETNPSMHNFDPRVGLAWDPFKDHKTSVRAGFGIFHSPVSAFDYALLQSLPWVSETQVCTTPAVCAGFPQPFQGSAAFSIAPAGIDPGDKQTPYMEQFNLTFQREIAKNTTATIGYVGSHGIHLIGSTDENPSLPAGVPGAVTLGAGKVLAPGSVAAADLTTGGAAPSATNGQAIVDPGTGQQIYATLQCPAATPTTGCSLVANNRGDPALLYSAMRRTTFHSTYSSLQAGLVRRMTSNLQLQLSYTYGQCTDNSSGSQPLENAEYTQNPYQVNTEKAWCGFMVRHTFYMNGVYLLPFHGNRLIEGWQLSGIFQYHTGTAVWADNGWASGIQSQTSGVINQRPNIVPNCNPLLGTIASWINPSCYTPAPYGEAGNSPRGNVFGPDSATLDGSVVKNTKISERFNLQFRAEFFNLLNRVNFRNPAQPVINLWSQPTNGTIPASCGSNPAAFACNPPNQLTPLTLTNTTARQIQFGLKLSF